MTILCEDSAQSSPPYSRRKKLPRRVGAADPYKYWTVRMILHILLLKSEKTWRKCSYHTVAASRSLPLLSQSDIYVGILDYYVTGDPHTLLYSIKHHIAVSSPFKKKEKVSQVACRFYSACTVSPSTGRTTALNWYRMYSTAAFADECQEFSAVFTDSRFEACSEVAYAQHLTFALYCRTYVYARTY
jgi:hypothetical protein